LVDMSAGSKAALKDPLMVAERVESRAEKMAG
jgi:hypothetical protein